MPTAKALCVLSVVLGLGSFAYYTRALFLKYPPVWPDEAIFSNPAMNLARRGAMATDLLSGTLPGFERCTYYLPPGYFLYLAAIFRVVKPGIVPLRLSSVAAAILVMILTYSVGRRSGLGPWLALIPVSLLGVDHVFLRGALMGRPDMLTLALILATLRLSMGSRLAGDLSRARLLAMGASGALAVLVHPMGVVALGTIVAARILPPGRRWQRMKRLAPAFLAGAFIVLPWAIYVLEDVNTFGAQFGSQFVRKASKESVFIEVARCFLQYQSTELQVRPPAPGHPEGSPQAVPGSRWGFLLGPLLWIGGLAGLDLAAEGRPEELPICWLLILVLILWGREISYPLYLVPLNAIGVAHLVKRASQGHLALAALVFSGCVWFAQSNLRFLSNASEFLNRIHQPTTDYVRWCAEIGKALPSGSKTLISVLPDPYFGLMDRPDLVLREFLPTGLPIGEGKYRRFVAAADYIIVGPSRPSENPNSGMEIIGSDSSDPRIDRFVEGNGQLVRVVGTEPDKGYYARVYRVTKVGVPAQQ